MTRPSLDYFKDNSALSVAKFLLGMELCTKIDGKLTAGIIVETEAYGGANDRASHSFNNRRTKRTEPMFLAGGAIYIYLCYGMHNMFNIVTNKINVPEAVLIRAIKPVDGVDIMLDRLGSTNVKNKLGSGPGKLTKSLGITREFSGHKLGKNIWIEKNNHRCFDVGSGKRIGVDYAGIDAKLHWRFFIKNNSWVSR